MSKWKHVRARTRWAAVPLAIGALMVASAPAVATAAAAETLERSPWQMFIEPTPHGATQFTSTVNGDRGFFQEAKVPAQSDSGWRAAPDPDTIGFDGSVTAADGKTYGGGNGSRLGPNDCLQKVDYTYFQTFVNVPAGTTVTDFQITFGIVDDAALITVYNDANPDGRVVDNSYVTLGQASSQNLASEITTGQNRVVITQLDDCAPGNNITAEVKLNGQSVVVDSTVVVPTTEPTEPTGGTPVVVPNARGDVHIATPDGLKYDFQEVGDYELTRSSSGDLVLQARQVTYPQKPSVSINGAGAVYASGDTLIFTIVPEQSLSINGTKTDLPTTDTTLPGGSQLLVGNPGDYTILLPDSSAGARVVYRTGYLDLGAAKLSGDQTFAGLLGNMDRDPSNDLTPRTGDALTPPATVEQLKTFGDTWRVQSGQSLFDSVHPEGENPTQEEKPQTVADLDPAAVQEATTTCQSAGVTDQVAQQDCVYDVAATGDKAFVDSAVGYQQAVEAAPEKVAVVEAVATSAADPSAAPASAASSAESSAAPSTATSAVGSAAAASSTGGFPIWIIVLIAVVVVVAIVVGVAMSRRGGSSNRA